MLIGRFPNEFAGAIICIRLRTKQYHRLVGLGALQEFDKMFRTPSNTRNQYACRHRVESPAMADFHFGSLLASIAEVYVVLAAVDFAFNPGPECGGGVEVFLQFAEDVG